MDSPLRPAHHYGLLQKWFANWMETAEDAFRVLIAFKRGSTAFGVDLDNQTLVVIDDAPRSGKSAFLLGERLRIPRTWFGKPRDTVPLATLSGSTLRSLVRTTVTQVLSYYGARILRLLEGPQFRGFEQSLSLLEKMCKPCLKGNSLDSLIAILMQTTCTLKGSSKVSPLVPISPTPLERCSVPNVSNRQEGKSW